MGTIKRATRRQGVISIFRYRVSNSITDVHPQKLLQILVLLYSSLYPQYLQKLATKVVGAEASTHYCATDGVLSRVKSQGSPSPKA